LIVPHVKFTKHEATLYKPRLTFLLHFIDAFHSLVQTDIRENKNNRFELSSEASVGFHLFKSRSKVFQESFDFTSWIFFCINYTKIECIFSERHGNKGADRAFASDIRVLFPQEVPDKVVYHPEFIPVESLLPLCKNLFFIR